MSLASAMFSGVSGLLNQAEGINVIGNNIANVNTVGFKGSRTLFSDVLSTTIPSSSNSSQMGHGVQLQKIDNLFTQSSLDPTSNVTDVAIQGDRFFVVAKPNTTGATAIAPDAAYFTRAGSFRLDGQQDTANNLAGTLINPEGYVVLDSEAMPIQIPLESDATGVVGAGGGYFFQKISGIDAQGVMSLLYADTTGASKVFYYQGGSGTTALADSSTTLASAVTTGKLGTVKIGNPPGMEKLGGTLFKVTSQSGIPAAAATTAWASNGITEKIFSNNLETSNVDMATEFVKMILTQRAYSANSKAITTSDEMTQEVLNLKR